MQAQTFVRKRRPPTPLVYRILTQKVDLKVLLLLTICNADGGALSLGQRRSPPAYFLVPLLTLPGLGSLHSSMTHSPSSPYSGTTALRALVGLAPSPFPLLELQRSKRLPPYDLACSGGSGATHACRAARGKMGQSQRAPPSQDGLSGRSRVCCFWGRQCQ